MEEFFYVIKNPENYNRFSSISGVRKFINSLSKIDYQLIDVYSSKLGLLDKNLINCK